MEKTTLRGALDLLREIRDQRTGGAKSSAAKKLDGAIRRIEKAIRTGNSARTDSKAILLDISVALLTMDRFVVFARHLVDLLSQ